jgi:long-chain fatty acid transport protein
MKKHSSLFILAPCMALLLCAHAAADDFHYNNVLIGDRASGMGGAYTAISDDAAGLYYNPAGIVFSSSKNISASVNAYQNLTKRYKGVVGSDPWERKSSSLQPNYFGIIQPVGKVTFGFSYAVPDAIHENQDQIFYNLPPNVASSVINFNNDDDTYNFGPSVAVALGKNASIGMTLYLHQRRAQAILNQLTNFTPPGYIWSNLYVETKEQGVRPVLGLEWSPVEKLSLGFAASRVLLYDSSTTIQVTCSSDTTPGCTPSPAFSSVSFDTKRKYPLQMAVGVAYFASPSLLMSVDATYYSKVHDADFGDKEAVLNIAIGTEYYFNKEWAIRGGVFTNRANTPDLDPAQLNQREHMDLYGTSLSLSRFTRNTSVSLGGIVSYGTGKAQIARNDPAIQDASTFGWTLFLSSSYSY